MCFGQTIIPLLRGGNNVGMRDSVRVRRSCTKVCGARWRKKYVASKFARGMTPVRIYRTEQHMNHDLNL